MFKLLHERICVILTTKGDIIVFIYILGYEFMMTAPITSWRQKVGAITATWPCCHGCHSITVWWNCLIFRGLLQKWLILMVIILVSLYFVKGKSYEHSLIIYWTALVYMLQQSHMIDLWDAAVVSPVIAIIGALYAPTILHDWPLRCCCCRSCDCYYWCSICPNNLTWLISEMLLL